MPPRKAKFDTVEQYQEVFRRHAAQQRHAGTTAGGKSIWHTHDDGTWWSGWTPRHLTTEALFMACLTTILDLLQQHPELAERLGTLFTQRTDG